MWICHKCKKPVYFAERKQSLGFYWHPKCLRCEECSKRLNPGQHAEHKGVPYCHHPCYGALFGPQLFGHGTRNECHTSFGKQDKDNKRVDLEYKLKTYNQYFDGRPEELKSKEVNGRLVFEGVLRIYWGVNRVIQLKEEDDGGEFYDNYDSDDVSSQEVEKETNFDRKENFVLDSPKTQKTNMTIHRINTGTTNTSCLTSISTNKKPILLRRSPARKMDKSKLKRRCSMNGHWYLRETSSFRPPLGCSGSVWVSSLVTPNEVVHSILDKYKVAMPTRHFALFAIKHNGEQRRLRPNEYPLETRVMLGPHEDVAKLYIMDSHNTQDISAQVADFLNLSLTECEAIIQKYNEEEVNQIQNLHTKYSEMRKFIDRRLKLLQKPRVPPT